MDSLREFFHLISSVEGITQIIAWGGLLILFIIVFAETGLLIGFFLPGDSLLITAGFVASTSDALVLWQILAALTIAAIVGDSTGYAIGRRAGVALYNRPKSKLFHPDKLLKAKQFYEHYGPMAIVLARFVPFARTFAPVVAGIAEMNYAKFVSYNIFGGILWVFSMTLLGYFFGQFEFVKHNMEKVLILVILLSVMPVVWHAYRAKRHGVADEAEQEAA